MPAEAEYEFLTIDHINGGGAKHRLELGHGKQISGKSIYYWLRDNNYPDGFQVLCFNCNMAKGRHKICPHQKKKEQQ